MIQPLSGLTYKIVDKNGNTLWTRRAFHVDSFVAVAQSQNILPGKTKAEYRQRTYMLLGKIWTKVPV